MKPYLKICILLHILLSCSCHKKEDVSIYYHEPHWKYYSIKINDTIIRGTEFDIYFKTTDSIAGTISNNKITWAKIDSSDNQKFSEMKGWRNSKNEIILPYDTTYFPKETIVLKPISKKIFEKKIDSSFHPKLISRSKAINLNNYTFDVAIENWNYQSGKGNTIVSIINKDKIVQTIKSNDFIFFNDITFEYVDKNFDNIKDLVFFIGNVGNKCSPAYDCYIFNPRTHQFEYNDDLSSIFSQMGTDVNEKEKTITSYSTGSCCSHYASKYKINSNEITKIKKMEILDESNGELKVTIEELHNKKWIKKVKIYSPNENRPKDLYKNF